jgi:purine nucleosidase
MPRCFSIWSCTCLLAAALAFAASAESPTDHPVVKRPVPLVFDTDMGNDIDDALALGVIHALESRGECKLLAVTVTKDEPMSAPFVDAINTFYARGDVPIGVVRGGPTPEPSKYTPIANQKDGKKLRFPHRLKSGADAPEAVGLLRRTLAKAEDHSVVIVQVGASTNLARLLGSEKDDASALPGTELVQKKVRLLSVMAGWFGKDNSRKPEYNVKIDVPSARTLFSRWPTPIVLSGFEVGLAVQFPAASIQDNFSYAPHHPLAEAYSLYDRMPYDRPTWDLTSVLYAVRPDRGYFELSKPGRVHVTDDGGLAFEPEATGRQRFIVLKPEQHNRVLEALVQLASQPPCTKP